MADPAYLDRLQRSDVMVTPGATPTQRMQLLWQRAMEKIEELERRIADLETP